MGGFQVLPAKEAVALSPATTANVGTDLRKNVSIWSLAKIIRASGLVSSTTLPKLRIAAMPASSCRGSSSGGRVNNCGACTLAIAATIFPMPVVWHFDYRKRSACLQLLTAVTLVLWVIRRNLWVLTRDLREAC